MANDTSNALVAVKLRYEFYRDGYRKLLMIIFVLILLNISIIWGIIHLIRNKPSPQFFATSPDGQIVQIHPTTQPVYSAAQIMSWATEAAINVYSYDYVNYRAQITSAQKYFSANGWMSFTNALKGSLMLKTVIDQRLVMSAQPTGAPTITNQGVVNNRYTWVVRIPMLVNLQGGNPISKPVEVIMQIQRVSLSNSPKGIAIVNYIAAE